MNEKVLSGRKRTEADLTKVVFGILGLGEAIDMNLGQSAVIILHSIPGDTSEHIYIEKFHYTQLRTSPRMSQSKTFL